MREVVEKDKCTRSHSPAMGWSCWLEKKTNKNPQYCQKETFWAAVGGLGRERWASVGVRWGGTHESCRLTGKVAWDK